MLSPVLHQKAQVSKVRSLKNRILRGHPRTFAGQRFFLLVPVVLFLILMAVYSIIQLFT